MVAFHIKIVLYENTRPERSNCSIFFTKARLYLNTNFAIPGRLINEESLLTNIKMQTINSHQVL
ncbi:MAG TPA: hypothetical protein VKI61_18925, partial [Chitinophagaceae bacterium]|nr:hypothetical protein [Chitinophagaceae bacterium]